MLEVAIVGGGLAGLSLAQQLNEYGINFALYEARQRFGGRILSRRPTPDSPFHYDLGPSWVWPDDQLLVAEFIQQHGLTCLPQWNQGMALFLSSREAEPQTFTDSETYASARRLTGGAQNMIESLLPQLPTQMLHLQRTLTHIRDCETHIELVFSCDEGQKSSVKAHRVALMLPPRVLAQRVSFAPELNPRLLTVMEQTPTWMAGHAKAVLHYEQAFWRAQGLSGSAFANYPGAILGEVFDACSDTADYAALAGFFALPAELRQRYRNDLEALVLDQMLRLFGPQAASPKEIVIQDWSAEPYTATHLDHAISHNHPSYGHRFFQLDHWNDKLLFGGTETAPAFGGYLEGALQSARFVRQHILRSLETRSCQTV